MQFCQDHWEELKKAVDDRGMSHLVAKDGKQAVDDAIAQLEGTDTAENWDPLMAAHWAIMNRLLEIMGLAALGDICPLCEVEKGAGGAQAWIDGCMDAMLQHAREIGLMPEVQ